MASLAKSSKAALCIVLAVLLSCPAMAFPAGAFADELALSAQGEPESVVKKGLIKEGGRLFYYKTGTS